MKQGQLLSQPFIYIFALILGALILIWGFKAIMDLKSTADQVDLGTFKNKIESESRAMYNRGEGSAKSLRVSLSESIDFVCFTDPGATLNCKFKSRGSDEIKDCPGATETALTSINDDNDAFLIRLQEPSEEDNLWFLPLGTAIRDSFKISNVKPVEGANPLCYQNGAEIVFETKTAFVEAR